MARSTTAGRSSHALTTSSRKRSRIPFSQDFGRRQPTFRECQRGQLRRVIVLALKIRNWRAKSREADLRRNPSQLLYQRYVGEAGRQRLLIGRDQTRRKERFMGWRDLPRLLVPCHQELLELGRTQAFAWGVLAAVHAVDSRSDLFIAVVTGRLIGDGGDR